MILVYDTETSNLPQKNLPLNHPAQGRIIQLAALFLDADFKERASFCSLIKPNGWVIQPGAQSAHGITQEECEAYGLDICTALGSLVDMAYKCPIAVGHNKSFDDGLVKTEYAVMDKAVISPSQYDYCTMQLMTPICQLKQANGRGKWPKLVEAYKHVTGSVFDKAHDALADCRATATVFKWLVDNKHVNVPLLVKA